MDYKEILNRLNSKNKKRFMEDYKEIESWNNKLSFLGDLINQVTIMCMWIFSTGIISIPLWKLAFNSSFFGVINGLINSMGFLTSILIVLIIGQFLGILFREQLKRRIIKKYFNVVPIK